MMEKVLLQELISNWEKDIESLETRITNCQSQGKTDEVNILIGKVQAINSCLYEVTYKVYKNI